MIYEDEDEEEMKISDKTQNKHQTKTRPKRRTNSLPRCITQAQENDKYFLLRILHTHTHTDGQGGDEDYGETRAPEKHDLTAHAKLVFKKQGAAAAEARRIG